MAAKQYSYLLVLLCSARVKMDPRISRKRTSEYLECPHGGVELSKKNTSVYTSRTHSRLLNITLQKLRVIVGVISVQKRRLPSSMWTCGHYKHRWCWSKVTRQWHLRLVSQSFCIPIHQLDHNLFLLCLFYVNASMCRVYWVLDDDEDVDYHLSN